MGWYGSRAHRGSGDVRKEILADYQTAVDAGKVTILGSASANHGRHLYVALERAESGRYIACFEITKSGGSWGYRPMDEFMGPYSLVDCPKSILALVPVSEEDMAATGENSKAYRAAWRRRVAAYHERMSAVYGDNEAVSIYGKPYTVVAKVKPGTYRVRSAEGVIYKATTKIMERASAGGVQ